jgi:2-keto-4-pentenoate hydratase/2-oxohepta-3-ene-1,7-dioic acid hydratase in catechol pathway
MKIVGFSNIDNMVQMVLKCDSSILVNRKPFFIPDWSKDVRMTPCAVLRVSRMGKNIGEKFASRYYDAVAPGLNICAADILAQGDGVKAWAFDYSLPLGKFMDLSQWQKDTIMSFDEAIHRVSEIMTIRQGDLIFVDCNVASRPLVKEEVIVVNQEEQELLYCKIK